MRRRDALSEKKRERLMQEHEQLQKLMLQARSNVRRSSLKNETELNPEQLQETNAVAQDDLQELEKPVLQDDNEEPEEPIVTKTEPLTEKDLFPQEVVSHQNTTTKPSLTEKELFPTSEAGQPEYAVPKSTVVKVIWPDQNVQATVAERKAISEENKIPYESTIAGPVTASDEQEMQEANPDTYNEVSIEETKPHRRTALFVTLVLLVLLAGSAGYYLYMSNQKKENLTAKPGNPTHTAVPVQQSIQTEGSSNTNTTATVTNDPVSSDTKQSTKTTPANKKSPEQTPSIDNGLSTMLKKFDNVTIIETPATAKNQAAPSNNSNSQTASASDLGKYKVVSKAYFHDAPAESTRRKAFIIHWNNAVLTPIEEKNGFMYVIFTNHLGQTTKGWLRKQDLQRID